MRKRVRRMSMKSARNLGRLPLIGIVAAIAVIAIAAVTVVSRQRARAERSRNQHTSSLVVNDAVKKFVTVKVGGQDIQVDGSTGKIKPLTQQEARELVEGVTKMVNQSTEGLKSVQHADGSVSMDLEDRFQNVIVAKQNDDGSLTTSCVDNPTSAARFFNVDEQSLPDQTRSNRKQPLTSARAGVK
jgi:hypothetical protein